MRIAFLSFLVAASAQALPAGSHLDIGKNDADDHRCRSGFFYREGWCTALSPSFYSFSGAVNYCASLGAYSPSIHSRMDLDDWSGSAFDLTPRFWLDASCPEAGEPNRWRDGTPTDYMGPIGELQSCTPNFGFVISANGFVNESYSNTNPAVCVYPVDPAPEPAPVDGNGQYCQCNHSAIELDIIFAADATLSAKLLTDETSDIQSILFGLPLGIAAHQSNVAALAVGNEVKTIKNFGELNNADDITNFAIPSVVGEIPDFASAISQASTMLSSTGRQLTRKVIVLVSKSTDTSDYAKAENAANLFKNSGGIIIIIDMGSNDAFGDIASPGYYFKDGPNGVIDSLCDANCFCPENLIPYFVENSKGRYLPMGCYRVSDVPSVFDDAQTECRAQNGFVSTIHDDAKNFFLLSLFPVKARHWLGFRRYGSQFVWSDGSNDGYTWWAQANPVDGLNCVYAEQTVGFKTGWFSAPCSAPEYSLLYACQTRPYDSGFSGTA